MKFPPRADLERVVVVRVDAEVGQEEVDQQLDVVFEERRASRERLVRLKRENKPEFQAQGTERPHKHT